MSRPTTWKSFSLASMNDYHKLQSYADSNRGAWNKYTIIMGEGWGHIETNLPWSELRNWFSFSFVKFPKDVLVDTMSTEESYADEELD